MITESLPVAVKKCPRSHHRFVTYLHQLAASLSDNVSFPNPSPSVAALTGAADALAQANAKAKHGGPAAVADRDAKRTAGEDLVDWLVFHVRTTVKAQATDPDAAAAMILSTGLSIKKRARTPKPPFVAVHGAVSGEVVLVARAVARTAVYSWEYSLDQETWTAAPQTLKARTTIAGLTPGQMYYFRFRAQTRKGVGAPSDAVKLMVI